MVEDNVVGGVVVDQIVVIAVGVVPFVDKNVSVSGSGSSECILDLWVGLLIVAVILFRVEFPAFHGNASEEDRKELFIDDLLIYGYVKFARNLICFFVVPAVALFEEFSKRVVLENP